MRLSAFQQLEESLFVVLEDAVGVQFLAEHRDDPAVQDGRGEKAFDLFFPLPRQFLRVGSFCGGRVASLSSSFQEQKGKVPRGQSRHGLFGFIARSVRRAHTPATNATGVRTRRASTCSGGE